MDQSYTNTATMKGGRRTPSVVSTRPLVLRPGAETDSKTIPQKAFRTGKKRSKTRSVIGQYVEVVDDWTQTTPRDESCSSICQKEQGAAAQADSSHAPDQQVRKPVPKYKAKEEVRSPSATGGAAHRRSKRRLAGVLHQKHVVNYSCEGTPERPPRRPEHAGNPRSSSFLGLQRQTFFPGRVAELVLRAGKPAAVARREPYNLMYPTNLTTDRKSSQYSSYRDRATISGSPAGYAQSKTVIS